MGHYTHEVVAVPYGDGVVNIVP